MSLTPGGLHAQCVQALNNQLEESGITQAELARRVGWSAKHMNQILNGHVEPSMASLEFMGFCLGVKFVVQVVKQ